LQIQKTTKDELPSTPGNLYYQNKAISKHYNFIVVGGGSAGYAAARTYRENRDGVAIVEAAGQLGGLCILRGCMPSKTLLFIADVLHHAKHGSTYGLDIPTAKADMSAINARKRRIIGEFTDYRAEQLESDKFDLYRSPARFIDDKTILLDDGTELTADHFLISTGSTITSPNLQGLDSVPALTSDDVLDLNELPESIIVLGGGAVACELVQFLSRMGSKVTQIQRSPQILKGASQESANVVMQAFKDEGIELFTGTAIKQVEQNGNHVRVTFEQNGKEITRDAAKLFNALGRKPNTAGLDLDIAGVELLRSGHIKTDAHQATTNPRVYAAGDCAGPHEIVHVAILQGETAAKHALGLDPDPVNYDLLTNIIFTDPQIAAAGIPEKELTARGVDFLTADFPFDDHGKSILMEAKYGYVKIWAQRPDGRILAAECVGKDAGELIHSLAVALALKATVFDLLKTHWYHPTLSEIWTYPLEEIADSLKK